MTTTNDSAIRKITALRDLARKAGTEHEAATALEKARAMCTKYGIDVAILDAKTEQLVKRPGIRDGQAPQTKKFSCRFGCGLFVQHTIDELNACAEKARNANGGNAYNAKARDPFDFGRAWSWGEPNADERRYDAPKARTNGSHKFCSHEATKSARARCRKDRGY